MRKHLFIAALAVAMAAILASCGNTRKATSFNSSSSTNTSKVDSSGKATVEGTTEKTTTEKVDTTVTTKADSLTATVDPDDSTEQVIETGTLKVTVKRKPNGKLQLKATAKPQTILVSVNRTTTERGTVKATTEGQVKKEAKATVEQEASTKAVSRWQLPWYVWLIFIAAIAAGAYRLYKRLRPG